jgi:GTP-binding protein
VAESTLREIQKKLHWKGPAFLISAATGQGTQTLMQAIMRYLEQQHD